MIDLILFFVCFYIAICMGINMKTNDTEEYSISDTAIAFFPVMYIYVFFVLLRSRPCSVFRLIRIFCSRTTFYLILKIMHITEKEIPKPNWWVICIRQNKHSQRDFSIKSETKKNIKNAFSFI